METKFNKGGAPKKVESSKRKRRVEILFTEEEFTQLCQRKSGVKVADLSNFIRSVCLDKPLRMKPQLSTHQENVLSLVREMRSDVLRIGVNINQSAKRINSTTDYYELRSEVNLIADNMAKIEANLRELMSVILDEKPAEKGLDQASDGSQN
ncbi:MobC family plasmid mobilization relaxosome protein [Spirosoma oryzicola]|uniref:MobC family plasmid mobilization relaxosome protein n=1 Tax=Spirosoma oryzicola TaxID=2898794 RepID=UPI001E5CAB9F|nr:MobC family plasmid mobilization relaxosome protein [Spirosoma oryzicola]UHG94695.1 MobC family plasmid mobilization relaxosome protein [Spirosoma oryzicola]